MRPLQAVTNSDFHWMSGITLLSLWAGRELTSKQGVPKDSFSYYPPKYLRINTHTVRSAAYMQCVSPQGTL